MNNQFETDAAGWPNPRNEFEAFIWARSDLIHMSRAAAKRGDVATAMNSVDRLEMVGLECLVRGQKSLGEETLALAVFYDEFNRLTLSGQETPHNVAQLYRRNGLTPPEE